jgi:hypothetical protein
MGYPGGPGWWLDVGLMTPPHKNITVTQLERSKAGKKRQTKVEVVQQIRGDHMGLVQKLEN